MEEPVNHPYHHHPLIKSDTRTIYQEYDSRWRCDVCQKSYDGRSNQEEHRYAYHCTQCHQPDYFDCCLECFKGHLHPFHHHRLKPGKSILCYPQTEGTWRCDACQRVFGTAATGGQMSSSKINYHCSKCSIDLCSDCFNGQWRHVSHSQGEHTLTPVDPRIQYRCYDSWSCDVCNQVGTHGPHQWLLFHCKLCQEDICSKCFKGESHHLHQHGLVQRERSSHLQWQVMYCSNCSRQLVSRSYYLCVHPNCLFNLCVNCYQAPPRPHPLHPEHVLHASDPFQVYPETGGVWYCDGCGQTAHPSAHSPSVDKMYHCGICEFDLCENCYRNKGHRTQDAGASAWALPPSSAPPLSQQYNFFAAGKDQYRRPPIGTRPSANFIPSPPSSLPAPTLCRICGMATARLTPTHRGSAHSEALYCQECAKGVLDRRESCYKCGGVPDGMVIV